MWFTVLYSDENVFFDEEPLFIDCWVNNPLDVLKKYTKKDFPKAIIFGNEMHLAISLHRVVHYIQCLGVCVFTDPKFDSVGFTVSSKDVYKNQPERNLAMKFPSMFDYELYVAQKTKSNKQHDTEDECNFLKLCHKIIIEGTQKMDRTGTGTYSLFSPQVLSYSLENGRVPCFTTKKVAWRNAIIELLWFISGSTNSHELLDKGVNWWVGNTSREFLDKRGLNEYEVGEMGPMYGWHWRNAGAKYVPQKFRVEGDRHGEGGVDQLHRLIDDIKSVRDGDMSKSRRLLMTTYIPQELEKAVLEPCHTFVQFHVDGEYLESVLYQRSGDMFLGVQINILSYSILTHLIANICGLKARRFHHHIGDAHIYTNHVVQMTRQLSRIPTNPPTISITHHENIDDYTIDDFQMNDYEPQSYISAPMAV